MDRFKIQIRRACNGVTEKNGKYRNKYAKQENNKKLKHTIMENKKCMRGPLGPNFRKASLHHMDSVARSGSGEQNRILGFGIFKCRSR